MAVDGRLRKAHILAVVVVVDIGTEMEYLLVAWEQ